MMSQNPQKRNKTTITLSILLGIMTLTSILLFMVIGVNELLWEDEYDRLDTEWFEALNDYTAVINDLLIDLKFLSADYDEFELLDSYDCLVEAEE